ncbi:cobalamin-binding protein [Undibacterium oligocarboniphilum]|uniref:Cobalamin-binding protein n=1 Tax=Undibacterium oligocarboniphilum TaxID=666702 RepID=A0A850QFS2_9BURK|nr:cobalamin-binding protein [Undibacterium oligocarboniphilum]NVO79342.1 cobalamin-binding protein [Undibacterium oligocarboniphilum]
MTGILFTISLFILQVAQAAQPLAISVTDDMGNTVRLSRPAQRVISLSPHVTELIFAAGGGAKIVGTVSYSDYPAAAKEIPRIGDNRLVDMERIMALKPDLLVVWMHGAFDKQQERLRQSGIPFFFSEPHRLAQVPETLQKFGSLLGTEAQAQQAAAEFRQQLQQLQSLYGGKPIVRTFYQVWHQPLYTLNDRHIVSDAIRLCGGENIFGRLTTIAPVVSMEAVLQENPEAIISSESPDQRSNSMTQWKALTTLLAVRNQNLVTINGDLMNRPGPRIIDGARAICEALEQARQHRQSTQKGTS